MKRTQVYIDYPTYRLAKTQAELRGVTVSQLIRDSLNSHVGAKAKPKAKINSLVQIAKLSQTFKPLPGTPTDIGLEHDHYLYGTPKKYHKK